MPLPRGRTEKQRGGRDFLGRRHAAQRNLREILASPSLRSAMPSCFARAAITRSMRGPFTMPGCIAFTRMLSTARARSRDSSSRPTTAHFVAEYGVRKRVAETSRHRRQRDDRAAVRARRAAAAPRGARSRTARSDSRRWSVPSRRHRVSSMPPVGPAMPALLISTSRPPSSRSHVGEDALDGVLVRDIRERRGDRVALRAGFGFDSASMACGSHRRHARARPSSTNACAITRPMPDAPPVTSTRKPRVASISDIIEDYFLVMSCVTCAFSLKRLAY